MFRLGDDLALRIPRRAVAAQLLRNEQIWLPLLKDRLPLAIPAARCASACAARVLPLALERDALVRRRDR